LKTLFSLHFETYWQIDNEDYKTHKIIRART